VGSIRKFSERKLDNQIAVMTAHSINAVGRRTGYALLSAIIFIVVQLSAPAAQKVTLAWNQSPDLNVIGYRVYHGAASRNYTNIVDVGNATSATISNLVEGATYYFAATAYNVLGMESEYSDEITYTVSTQSVLAIKSIETNGIATAVSITASGAIPNRWALESSPDLTSWATLARGTNSPVNVSTPLNGAPRRFFRLKAE
jgi:hypothetical protein